MENIKEINEEVGKLLTKYNVHLEIQHNITIVPNKMEEEVKVEAEVEVVAEEVAAEVVAE